MDDLEILAKVCEAQAKVLQEMAIFIMAEKKNRMDACIRAISRSSLSMSDMNPKSKGLSLPSHEDQ